MKQGRIGQRVQPRRFGGRLDQAHMAPALRGDTLAGLVHHLGALLDAHDPASPAHRVVQQGKAQAGAATHVQHGGATDQVQASDGLSAQGLEQCQLAVVTVGARAVLRQGRAAVGLSVARGKGTAFDHETPPKLWVSG
ncbi:hypothetical protein FQZ97_1030960 [compost metagenome]